MIKLGKLRDVDDGTEDIVFTEDGVTVMRIKENFYKSFGFTYEQMGTTRGLAEFFAVLTIQFSKGISND